LQVAAEILSARLLHEVREAHGLAYEAHASYSPSRAYPRASLLSVGLITAPDRVFEAEGVTRAVVERMARAGPRETELAAARLHLRNLAERVQGEPKYWARVLAELDTRGLKVRELRQLPALFGETSAESAQGALARCVVDEARITVFCHPARSAAPPSAAGPQADAPSTR
jgi:predicted Zn-dependent peptidase